MSEYPFYTVEHASEFVYGENCEFILECAGKIYLRANTLRELATGMRVAIARGEIPFPSGIYLGVPYRDSLVKNINGFSLEEHADFWKNLLSIGG